MAEPPQQLPLEGELWGKPFEHHVDAWFSGKAGQILTKVASTGEPFFILRAKDIFTPMVIREYLRLIEQYSPEDHEFQQGLMEVLTQIRNWQKSHIGEVRYPD